MTGRRKRGNMRGERKRGMLYGNGCIAIAYIIEQQTGGAVFRTCTGHTRCLIVDPQGTRRIHMREGRYLGGSREL